MFKSVSYPVAFVTVDGVESGKESGSSGKYKQ